MSNSFEEQNLEGTPQTDGFEDIQSPTLYPPPNSSPNISSNVTDDKLLSQTELEQEIFRDNQVVQNFENESINVIPSEMPSLLLRPTEITNSDNMDSEEMLKSTTLQLINQIQQEDEDNNEIEEDYFHDTFTTPHPASQVELENNQLEEIYTEHLNLDDERTSNFRQRVTPMPTDPAEDTRDPNLVSQNHSIMNSLMIEKEYGRFFPKSKKTPEIVGFNMKHYEEELVKLRNDNFSLKLRIHLLEERQGLVIRPEDNDKENVFRVNIDLKVERETLKQQIDENSKLLREALDALEQMESEKEQERSRYEEEIVELKKFISQQTPHKANIPINDDDDNSRSENKKSEEISANSQKLLFEAFGSMNLGTHPETDEEKANSQQDLEDEEEETSNNPEHLHNYEKSIQSLEENLANVEDKYKSLKITQEQNSQELVSVNEIKENLNNQNENLQQQIEHLSNEKKSLNEKNEALSKEYEEMRIEMSTELEEKHVECVNLHQDIDTNQDEISSLCQKINHSEQELRIHKQEKNLADEKVQGLNYDLATVKARLDQQKNDSDVLKEKAMQVNDLQLKLASKTLQLRTVEENQSKAELCISGLTQMTIEQKQAISRLEKEVNTRDKAIDKLTAEYEKVKAKVRKYRSLREQYENQIHGQGIIGDNSGSSIGERDNMYNARDEENDDKPHSNSSLQKNTIIVSENNPKKEPAKDKELKYLVEEVQLHQKEIALLKGELRVCKSVFMKTGASRAMEKVEKVYNDQMTKVDHAHGKIVGIMRRRLEELADCIQKILGSHNGIISGLNMSNLSTGDVSALSDILNESRRLSRSFFTAQSLGTVNERAAGDQNQSGYIELHEGEMSNVSALIDPNETQLPAGVFKFPANEIMESVNVEIDEKYNVEGIEPHSTSPKTPMDILGNRLKEYECLMDDLKASAKQKVEAHQELIRLKQENAETATLKTRLAETNVILEDLRIKHGNEKEKLIEAKERLRESMKENLALKTIKARKKEAEKGLEQLCMNYQEEIEKLKTKVADQQIMEEMKNKVEKYRNQIEQFQNEAIYWKTEAEKQANGSQHKVEYLQDEIKQMTNQVQQLENELSYWRTAKSNVNDEIEQLKRQLRDAEATVARYRSRQEKVDKKLRSELAKTHNVLKKTKANLNECKEQVPS